MSIEPKYILLYQIANETVDYIDRRGYYYGLNMWNEVFTNWSNTHNNGTKTLPDNVLQYLNSRHFLFRDYFV